MTRVPIGIGYSPCPNDTFMFHALVHGLVEVPRVRFEPWLADIEELNRRAAGDDALPVTKLSAFAALHGAARYAIAPAGAALGRGVGPLVVVRQAGRRPDRLAELAGRRVAIPGRRTTAHLLLRCFAGADWEPVEMRFDRILGAVARGEVDAGLVIHESRFTYAGFGLERLADLGELWEAQSGLPLPLGVIGIDRGLPATLRRAITQGIASSVRYAQACPDESRSYVRAHAQELADDVCARHIALYVNESSAELGAEGRAALEALAAKARAFGLAPPGPPLFGDDRSG